MVSTFNESFGPRGARAFCMSGTCACQKHWASLHQQFKQFYGLTDRVPALADLQEALFQQRLEIPCLSYHVAAGQYFRYLNIEGEL